MLDVANNAYYHLPFLMALLAWEAIQRERPPVLSLAAVSLVWITVVELPTRVSADLQAAAYLAWTLPALAVLTWAVFRLPVPKFWTGRSASDRTRTGDLRRDRPAF